eukprot:tig00020603_g11779.t1
MQRRVLAAAVLLLAAVSAQAAVFDAYAVLKVADATQFAGEGLVLAKFVNSTSNSTTLQLYGLHSGINVVSYSIAGTTAANGTVTKTPSSKTPNVLIETVGNLTGVVSNGTVRSGVTISLTFRTANGNLTRDTTISGALTSVPGTFASYAVLLGSSDSGCLPPSLATMLWTAASTEALAASAQATLTASNASVIASSVKGYSLSKGISGTPTAVYSGVLGSPAAYFDSVTNAYLAVQTSFYTKAVAGSFVRPTATDFPTAAPQSPTCTSVSVTVILPITLAQCQDSKTQAGLAAGAASTAGVDSSSVTVQCAALRRSRSRRAALQTSSTKVTYVFASTGSVSAGAAAQAFLQQIGCTACVAAFSNNVALGLASAGSSLTVAVTGSNLQIITPTGAVVYSTSYTNNNGGSTGVPAISASATFSNVSFISALATLVSLLLLVF